MEFLEASDSCSLLLQILRIASRQYFRDSESLGSSVDRPPPSLINRVCIIALFSLERVSKIIEPKVRKPLANLAPSNLCKDGVQHAMYKEIFVENGDFELLITIPLIYC